MHRSIYALILLLALCSPAWANPALVQQATSNGGATNANGSISLTGVTSGNLLVLIVGFNSTAVSVSGVTSTGDTWVQGKNCTTGTGNGIWYALNAASGTTSVTITFSGGTSGRFYGALMEEFSGVSGFDKAAACAGATASATLTSTTFKPDYTNALVVTGGAYTSASATSTGPTNSYTALTGRNDGTNSMSTIGAYLVINPAANTSTGWTTATAHNWGLTSVAFQCTGCSPVAGVNRYVNRDTGSDSNDGLTTGTPLQHIQTCENNANPGDTCYVMDTTNRTEDLVFTNAGLPSDPITITTYQAPADAPNPDKLGYFLGLNVTGCKASACAKVLSVFFNASYITIDHLDISNQETSQFSYASGSEGGIGNNQVGINASNSIVQHSYIHDSCRAAIIIDPTTSFNTISYNTFYRWGSVGAVAINGHDNTISYNDMAQGFNHIYNLGGIFAACGNSSESTNYDADWIRIQGWNQTVSHNYEHDMYNASNGSTTDPNAACNGNGTQTTSGGETISNPYCTGSDTGTNGSWALNGSSNSAPHSDCLQSCSACAELGGSSTQGAKGVMASTYSYNTCIYPDINMGGVQHTGNMENVDNTQCLAGTNNPVSGCTGAGTGTPEGVDFINNWFINTGQLGFGPGAFTDTAKIVFNTWNHIQTHAIVPTTSNFGSGTVVTDNMIFDNYGSGNTWWAGPTTNVTGSNNACGYRSGGGCSDTNESFNTTLKTTTAPGFVTNISPVSGDYSLKGENDAVTSASVLNGAGTAISGVTTDLLGVTRPNPPSIGAFETQIFPQASGSANQ